jgi:hypothetical protein
LNEIKTTNVVLLLHHHIHVCLLHFWSPLDNQEVYQDCNEETGSVLVIEILEYRTTVKDDDACVYFLQDLDVKPENVYDWHDSYIDDTDDDNEESQLLQEQPKVIDLIYNNSMNRNYWLPNLKLPPPYNTDDDINHSDMSLKVRICSLHAWDVDMGWMNLFVLTLKCVYCVSKVWKRIY